MQEAKVINGRKVAKDVKSKVKAEVESYLEQGYRKPKLVVILVGDDQASKIYIRNKQKAAKKCLIDSENIILAADTKKEELIDLINKLNNDETVDGILLQLPLPEDLAPYEQEFINLISPEKDVDGFHPINIGKLSLKLDAPVACTAAGIMKLIDETGEDLKGKVAVVIGRSNIVGKPVSLLLLHRDCTVIMTHSKTKDLKSLTKLADILVVAIGKREYVGKDMVKEGAIVIDVGMNRDSNGKVKGDVNYPEVKDVAGYITKVPGGVGPMTVAMLMQNTLDCYKKRIDTAQN